jgi:hypothetical protein
VVVTVDTRAVGPVVTAAAAAAASAGLSERMAVLGVAAGAAVVTDLLVGSRISTKRRP